MTELIEEMEVWIKNNIPASKSEKMINLVKSIDLTGDEQLKILKVFIYLKELK